MTIKTRNDSKVPAKRSRKSLEKSQPAEEGDSKVSAKKSCKSQDKSQPADVDISKVPAKISHKKKVTSQPADEGNSKVPAKRSRKSQEKAQPAEEGDSKSHTIHEKALQNFSIKVGHQLSLYWPNDDKWYKAIVTSKDSADSNLVSLLYLMEK